MTERRLLLAGSTGPERVPARPDPHHADWYLPRHVRDARGARERIAEQVVAGADVVVAPTWLTHRRALLPLGETRRAAAWTVAAVQLAREALEAGLEQRIGQGSAAEVRADQEGVDRTAIPVDRRVERDRFPPLLAASLPALDDGSGHGDGHLLPRAAAAERDYRDQAGIIADAAPDLILVEGQPTAAEARVALAEAAQTGLPTWVALSPSAMAAEGVDEWLDVAAASGIERLLLPGPSDASTSAAQGQLPWGAVVADPDSVGPWLEMGAGAVALLDGATPERVRRLRFTLDEFERPLLEAAIAADQRWRGAVERAAALAPGGHALWLGRAPAWALPDGFDWLVLDPAEAGHLPADRFRLVVVDVEAGPDLSPALDHGGVLIGHSWRPSGLRRLEVDDAARPTFAIHRRDD